MRPGRRRSRRRTESLLGYRLPAAGGTCAGRRGSGTGGHSLTRIRMILAQPETVDKIQATVDTVHQHGAAAGYKAYFSQNGLSEARAGLLGVVG